VTRKRTAAKHVTIGARPVADASADSWVHGGNGDAGPVPPAKAEVYTARLTLDVTPAMRGRLKVIAFQRGVTVAEMLRAVLEREFPENGGAA